MEVVTGTAPPVYASSTTVGWNFLSYSRKQAWTKLPETAKVLRVITIAFGGVMENKTGYSTTTYRLKLRCKHLDWVQQTKALYNEVIAFYHQLLTERTELLDLGNMEMLRRMEQLTVVGRDRKPVEAILPFQKVPVYFRRAAINAAIGYGRSYRGLVQDWEKKKQAALQKGLVWEKKTPSIPSQFHASPLLYQGMYKEFGEGSILIKLWNGESWSWVKHTYSGRKMEGTVQTLSPTLVLQKKSVFLHVPIVKPVEDVRTVRERVQSREPYCAVNFTSSDVLATCVLFNSDGHATDSYFIRGGKELAYRRKRLLSAIYKKRSQTLNLQKGENRHLWKRLKNLNIHYAHLVSKRIIDYCTKNQIKLVVVPQLTDGARESFRGNQKRNFIGHQIIQNLGYKAWKSGIVMTAVRPYYAATKCSHCLENIKRYNEGHLAAKNYYGGRLFVCPNGHQGNSALNSTRNIGSAFHKFFDQRVG